MAKSSVSTRGLDVLLRAHAAYNPISIEEEADLVRRAQAGDAQAMHRLVTAHLRFVFACANEFRRHGSPFEELVSEGLLGFMEGVQRFDPERGARLASYAGLWVRALLRRYTLDNRRIVRPPSTRAARKLLSSFGQTRHQLAQQLGKEPEAALIARTLGVEVSDVEELEQVMRKRDVACDSQGGEGTCDVASPSPSPEAVVAERELVQRRHEAIAGALRELTPREQKIIVQRSLQETPSKLSDLGSELGLSRERVRQLETQALAKMRGVLANVA